MQYTKASQKSKQLLKKPGQPYMQRPNRFRTLHKQAQLKQKKPQKTSSIQNSYGNIIINISQHMGSRNLKSRTGNNYGSLDIDFDNDSHKLSLRHRRSLDCDKFKAVGQSRLIKAKSNLRSKEEESRQFFKKPPVAMVGFKQSVSAFITNFQSVLDAPIDLQTYKMRNPFEKKCMEAGGRILGIVMKRKMREWFRVLEQ